jgi:hypothetical protein
MFPSWTVHQRKNVVHITMMPKMMITNSLWALFLHSEKQNRELSIQDLMMNRISPTLKWSPLDLNAIPPMLAIKHSIVNLQPRRYYHNHHNPTDCEHSDAWPTLPQLIAQDGQSDQRPDSGWEASMCYGFCIVKCLFFVSDPWAVDPFMSPRAFMVHNRCVHYWCPFVDDHQWSRVFQRPLRGSRALTV